MPWLQVAPKWRGQAPCQPSPEWLAPHQALTPPRKRLTQHRALQHMRQLAPRYISYRNAGAGCHNHGIWGQCRDPCPVGAGVEPQVHAQSLHLRAEIVQQRLIGAVHGGGKEQGATAARPPLQ